MQSRFVIIVIVFLLGEIGYPLGARQTPSVPLTLEKAIALTLENNRDIQVAELEVKKSRQGVWEAYSHLLPKIDAEGRYTRNIQKPVIFLPPGTPFSPPGGGQAVLEIGYDNAYLGGVSLSLPIFVQSAFSGISLAKKAARLQEEALQGTRSNAIAGVKKAYYGVLMARKVYQFMEMSLASARENLETIRRMEEQGLVSRYDKIRAEVQVENLTPVVMQAHDSYRLALEHLKIQIGLDANTRIEILDSLQYDSTYKPPTLTEALQQALQANPVVRQLQISLELAAARIGLEKASFYPNIVAFGNYQYQAQANDFNFSDYNWVQTSMVGVQVQFPLYHGTGRLARVQQAKIEYQQAKTRLQAVTEAIKIQVQSALFQVHQAQKRIAAQRRAIRQAEMGYRIARTRYRNGLSTQLEVNDAQVALTQAQVNYAKAVYDFWAARTDLENLTGQIVSEEFLNLENRKEK